MEIEWSNEAILSYQETISYWDERTKSNSYSDKIIDAVQEEEENIRKNPYFLSRYHKSIQLYQKSFFSGKFSLFYQIIEEEQKVYIVFFRSNRQKPIYE